MIGGADVRRSSITVGRQVESARLARLVDAAAEGRGGCCLLVGEGGVGKTRLLVDLAARARDRGLPVLSARAAITAPHAFGIVNEALRSWLRDHPRTGDGTAYDRGLQLVLPEWPVPDDAARLQLTEGQLRLLAVEGVARLVRDIATDHGGLLLVLDDTHDVDADSIEAIRYLATAALPGVGLAVALRPHELPLADELVRTLHASGVAEVLEIEPLTPEGVGALVAAIATAPPPPELVGEIVRRTDGVPLLVEELLAAHLRAGSVGVAEGTMVWRGDAVAVPTTVRELVAARLARLSGAERTVVLAGAVLGELTPPLLASVTGTADVDPAVAAGVRAGLLERAGGTVTFRHAIVRDAVLASAGAGEVRRVHAAAAAALAGDDTAVERRAFHLEAAGEPDAAAALLAGAAAAHVRTHALLTAEALARDAVRLARDPIVQSSATDALARSLAAQGRWTEALAADETAASAHGDTAERRERMAVSAVEAGRPDLAAHILERAAALGDSSPLLDLAAGRVALVGGDAGAALTRADHVLGLPTVPADARLAALDLRGRAHDFLGQRDAAEAAWTQQADEARAAGHVQAQLRALVQLGKAELFAGRPVRRLREAVDVARNAGALIELAWAEENLSIAYGINGDLDASAAVLDDAIPRCRALRLDQLAYLLVSRAALESYRGEGDEYARWLDEAEALLPTDDLRVHSTSLRADVALRDGRYGDAVDLGRTCLRIVQAMPGIVPVDSVCYYVWSLIADGRDEAARAVLPEVRALPGLERWHTRPLLLDLAEGLLSRDPVTIDRMLAGTADLLPIDRALVRQIAADIVGDGDESRRWLREAHDAFAQMGARRAAARVRQMMRATGVPVPRARVTSEVPAGLAEHGVTARETEVLRLVAEGCTNSEIAERLVLSVRTVETHVSALLTKLHVTRRGQLAAATRELLA
ncbi:MAG TPA: AAA family ATPase [Mycobacteriales bacterium]|nr:AAA family ATPase [Mycobacteriales bacterium]